MATCLLSRKQKTKKTQSISAPIATSRLPLNVQWESYAPSAASSLKKWMKTAMFLLTNAFFKDTEKSC